MDRLSGVGEGLNSGFGKFLLARRMGLGKLHSCRDGPKNMRRLLLLINPRSRRGLGARQEAARALKELGFVVTEPSEEDPRNFPEIIRRFAGKVDVVAVGGGDGTIRTVIPAMLETNLPVGILPLGTANNLARNLGVPGELREACAVIRSGAVEKIDLGRVNEEYFVNVAGIGLSAEINRGVPAELKRRWGVAGYGIYGAKILRRIRPFKSVVQVEGREMPIRSVQITVCNGRHFGAGLMISPDATISDAHLDLCGTDLKSIWQVLPLLLAMRKGEQKRFANVVVLRSAEFEIRTARPMWIDTDGEVTTRTPARFSVMPLALRVIGSGAR